MRISLNNKLSVILKSLLSCAVCRIKGDTNAISLSAPNLGALVWRQSDIKTFLPITTRACLPLRAWRAWIYTTHIHPYIEMSWPRERKGAHTIDIECGMK